MKDQAKTKEQLINELVDLRQRVAEVEELKAKHKQAEDELRKKVRVMVQTEETLKAEQFMLQQCLENLPLFAYNISFDGKIAGVNNRAVKGLGYANKDELIGKPLISTIYAPGSRKKAKQFLKKWRNAGKLKDEELKVITKQGKVIDVLLSVDAIFDQNGKPMHILSTQLDITESKHAEKELRENKEKLQRIFECINDGIVITDFNGVLIDLNEKELQLGGFGSKSDLLGKSALEIIAPHDRERALSRMQELVQPGHFGLEEITMVRADGSRYLTEMSTNMLKDAAGNPVGFVYVIRDITERRQMEEMLRESEERFRQLAENIQEVFWLGEAGESRGIFYLSPSFERVWRRKAQEVYENEGVMWESIYEEDREKVTQIFEGYIQGRRAFNVEFRIVRPDGSVRWVWAKGFPIKDESGKAFRTAGIMQDITDRKEAEEEIRKYRQDLETIFNSGPAAIWYKNRENRILRVNKAGANSIGRNVKEIEGKSAEEIFPLGDAEHYYQDDMEVMSSGKPKLNIIEERQTSSGERKWVCTDKVPYLDDQGNITGIIAFVRDITARKHAEEQVVSLAKFPSENPNPVLRVSREGSILYANEASKPLLDDWCSKIGQFVPAHWNKLITESLNSGQSRIEEIKAGDRILSFVMAPIIDAGYVNLYGRDITERKWAEEALTQRLEFEQLISGIRADFINLPLDNIDEGINRALKTIARFGGA
ncbi:MAG: PAS domain S-box protein, partial [Thiotrichaceae bacterium]